MLMFAGIIYIAAIGVFIADSILRKRKILKFENHSQKAFEPVYEVPKARRVCGYLVGGNSWKK